MLNVNVYHTSADKFESLNNKYLFSKLCREIGVNVPDFHLLESDKDVFEFNDTL